MKYLLCLLLSTAALATEKIDQPEPDRAVATATSTSDNDSFSSAVAGSNSNSGGNQVSNTTTVRTERNVASAHANAGNSTAPCVRDQRAGLQLAGFGVSGGRGKIDPDCILLKAADEELARGNLLASIKLRCATKAYKALGADCEALLNTQTKPEPEQTCPAPDYATAEQLERAFRVCAGSK